MNKIYKVLYTVDKSRVAECNVFSYTIVDEKPTYYVLQVGSSQKHLKKEKIDLINHTNIEDTEFETYITTLNNIDMVIKKMSKLVQERALQKIKKYQQIYNNATTCAIKMVEVN